MSVQFRATRAKQTQTGVSLIEVLIALVLISIGLLGISASQISSLKLTYSAYQRSQATLLANDIADRMRANITQAELVPSSYTTSLPGGIDQGTDCVNYTGALTGTCSTAEMAEQDIFDWQQRIASTLNGQGFICRDNTPDSGTSPAAADCDDLASSPLVIKIWWDDDRNATTADLLFATSIEL